MKRRITRRDWQEFLKSNGMENNLYAKIISQCLPRIPHPKWFAEAVEALESNARSNGKVWNKWLDCGLVEYDDLISAVVAYKRHTETNYDALLANGVPREEARELIKESA